MLIMVDTNVLISALLFPGERMGALFYKITTEHQLILSSYVVDELLAVTRRKFPNKVGAVDLLLIPMNSRREHDYGTCQAFRDTR